MAKNSERSWEAWGEIDPYFGVVSHDKFKKGNLDVDTLAQFFLGGQEHVDLVMSLARRLNPEIQFASVLDFGCGVGRLLFPFSKLFKRAVGVDISDGMRRELQANADKFSINNVEVFRDLDQLPTGETFDLVHSFIVLQHIETKDGMAIIEKLADLARPDGGLVALHVTYWRKASVFRKAVHYIRARSGFVNMAINALKSLPVNTPLMQMNSYKLNAIFERLHHLNFVEFSGFPTNHGGHLGIMILAKRNTSSI